MSTTSAASSTDDSQVRGTDVELSPALEELGAEFRKHSARTSEDERMLVGPEGEREKEEREEERESRGSEGQKRVSRVHVAG
jgi:hypothetical protein